MNCLRHFFLNVISSFVILLATQICSAQVSEVELPRSFTDFAINPINGAVCGVEHTSDEVVILKQAFIDDGNEEGILAPISVGSTPVAVTFKVFGDKRYFVVCCTQDAHLYVIDADSFELVKKVPVEQSGVSHVTNSRNPDDPFVYYCFGGGHGSMTGAIDLRKFTDCGSLFDRSMDCMISADGKTAYRRGPWSPSGFESLRMTNSFEDPRPDFARLFYDHNSTAQYLPDPFGELTAAGNAIFTKDLKRKVAQSDQIPVCFLTTKPFAICAAELDPRRSSGEEQLSLTVISSNTFNKVGAAVVVGKPAAGKQVPRGSRGSADFKRVRTRTRFLEDEQRERLLVARDNVLSIVRLAEFDLPDEVALRIVNSSYDLAVGKNETISLAPTRSKVKVKVDDLPDGATIDGNQLTWTPSAEQVGIEKIPVHLSYNNIEREQVIDVTISFPSIKLPIEFTGLAVAPGGEQAVVWQIPANPNQRGHNRNQGKPETLPEDTVVLIDLKTTKCVASKKMPFKISSVNIDSHFVYVASAEASYCQVLSKETLEKKKTLYSQSIIPEISTDDKELTLLGEHYHLPTLEKLPKQSGADQVLARLWDAQHGNSGRSRPTQRADVIQQNAIRRNAMNGMNSDFKEIDSMSALVVAWKKSENRKVPGGVHTSEMLSELGLDIYSEVSQGKVKTIKLSSKIGPVAHNQNSKMKRTQIEVHENKVFVLSGDELYQWDASQLDRADLPQKLTVKQSPPTLVPATGNTKISLPVEGGKPPYKFALLGNYEGIELDEAGSVVVDNQRVTENSHEQFLTQIARDGVRLQAGSSEDFMSRYDREVRQPFEEMMGQAFPQFPVRVTVQYRVVDEQSQSTEQSLVLVVGVDKVVVAAELSKVRKLHAERMAEQKRMRERAGVSGVGQDLSASAEIVGLRTKVESLEARLDLMSVQLNQIRKLLEKQSKQ